MDRHTQPEIENVDPKTWVALFGDELFRFAIARVKTMDAAEDIVQETLLSAIQSLDNFQGKSTIKTWIFAILRNKLNDHYARQAKGEKFQPLDILQSELTLADLLKPNISSSEFDSRIEEEEFTQALADCQALLPPHLGEAFLFRNTFVEKTSKEIANEIGITESNLSVRLFRARLILRKCLERTWLGRK